jgi:hypothetical protein
LQAKGQGRSWSFSGTRARNRGIDRLEQVPLIAVEIFEDSDGAIRFLARGLEELDVGGEHETIIAPEIIGVKEEEHAASGLLADLFELFWSGGAGEKKIGALRAGRGDENPPLVGRQRGVFHESKAQGFREEGERFVIVANKERDVSERLRHGA